MAKDTVLDLTRVYHRLGMAPIWLQPQSKRPIGKGWTTGGQPEWEHLKAAYRPGMNVGVRLGTPSRLQNGFLACIDVDIRAEQWREPAERCLAEVLERMGAPASALPEVQSGGGIGSRHLYLLSPAPFPQTTFAHHKKEWGVTAYSDGRQMVLPPSVHPDTGKQYRWKAGVPNAFAFPVLSVPEGMGTRDQVKEAPGGGVLENFETVVGAELLVEELSAGMQDLLRMGVTGDRSAALVPITRALLSTGATSNEILTILTDPQFALSQCAYDHVGSRDRARAAQWLWRYTVERLWNESHAVGIFSPVPIKERAMQQESNTSAGGESGEAWKAELHRGGPQGQLKADITNIRLLLENLGSPKLFRLNQFSNHLYWGATGPWGKIIGSPVTDGDINELQDWLCATFEINAPPTLIWAAVVVIARKNAFHPVREYLRSLEWDGVPRVDTWLKDYLHASSPEPYLSDVSRKFLLAAVARVLEPGIKFDHTLVLEGDQGIGKSTAPMILAAPWFTSGLPNIKDKDALISLQGSWVIEIPELTSLKRVDLESYKAFFSASSDRFRVPYGRSSEEFPRQCVFIGTTNHTDYLVDKTGNRRFWPIEVKQCDFQGLKRDRDQLWAEALVLWETFREDLFLSGEVQQVALEVQDSRIVESEENVYEVMLHEFLEKDSGLPEEDRFDLARFTLKELFRVAYPGVPPRNWTLQQVARILKRTGFERYLAKGVPRWRLPSAVAIDKTRLL